MKFEQVILRTKLNAAEVAEVFRGELSGRKVIFEKVDDEENPFAAVETPVEFSAVASQKRFHHGWAMQIYVYDEGDARLVELRPLHNSFIEILFVGPTKAYWRSGSKAKCDLVYEALRRVDPSLRVA